LAGETEVLEENLLQCHFIHHKSHMTSWDRTPGRRDRNPATKGMSCGAAFT
jgi:hypothetical protein